MKGSEEGSEERWEGGEGEIGVMDIGLMMDVMDEYASRCAFIKN